MTMIRTSHGTFTGKTVGSITRREYGRNAYMVTSGDPNSPEVAYVVRTDKHGTHVLAKVFDLSTSNTSK